MAAPAGDAAQARREFVRLGVGSSALRISRVVRLKRRSQPPAPGIDKTHFRFRLAPPLGGSRPKLRAGPMKRSSHGCTVRSGGIASGRTHAGRRGACPGPALPLAARPGGRPSEDANRLVERRLRRCPSAARHRPAEWQRPANPDPPAGEEDPGHRWAVLAGRDPGRVRARPAQRQGRADRAHRRRRSE